MPTWDDLFTWPEFIQIESRPDTRVVTLVDIFRARNYKRVYDLGCGIGRHVILFASYGFDVFGSDISQNGLEYAKRWLQQEGLTASLFFADMTTIPCPSNYFDAIVCRSVITHNTVSNIQKYIHEMYRTLRSGGMVYVTFISPECSDYGNGEQVEPNTFLLANGPEAGILHHFTTRGEITSWMSMFKTVDLLHDVTPSPPQGNLPAYTSAQWIFLGEAIK